MSALDGWIDICRAGTWQDLAGRAVRLDADRLDRIVAAHAAADPAPVVVGHPATDAPAYAWIEGLRRVGDRLQATLRDIAPAFREAVEAGLYSGRSIALQGDTLRHVGFLGGRAPAMPGLAPTRFAAEPEAVLAFEDGASCATDDGGAESTGDPRPPHPDPLRTGGATGDEDGDSLVPLSAPAGRGGDDGDDIALAERATALDEREAQLAMREAALAADERRRQAEAALARYVEAGRVLPAERAGLAALLAALVGHEDAEGEEAAIVFASADGSEERAQPATLLERLLEGLPRRVDYRTLAGGPLPGDSGPAGAREAAQEDSGRIAAEARALMAAEAERGATLTPADAVDRARARRGLGTGGGAQ